MANVQDVKDAYGCKRFHIHQEFDKPYEVRMYDGQKINRYEIDVETVDEVFEELIRRKG